MNCALLGIKYILPLLGQSLSLLLWSKTAENKRTDAFQLCRALDKRSVTTDFRDTFTFCTVRALQVPIYNVYWSQFSPVRDQLCWKHTSEIKSGTAGLWGNDHLLNLHTKQGELVYVMLDIDDLTFVLVNLKCSFATAINICLRHFHNSIIFSVPQ